MDRRKIKYIAIFLIVIISIISLTIAYRTDHKAKVNEFTTGKVKISLTEEKYNLSENVKARKDIAPREVVVKDPKITNTGKSDAFVFLEVLIPRTNRILIDNNGQKLPIEFTDAFEFTPNRGWVNIESEIVTISNNNIAREYQRYVYAYLGMQTVGRMAALKKGQSTPTLFLDDQIKHKNFIEVENRVTYDIPVNAYAIQTTDLKNSLPTDVWNVVKAQVKSEGGR